MMKKNRIIHNQLDQKIEEKGFEENKNWPYMFAWHGTEMKSLCLLV